ncbi:porin [Actinobacillus porcinus]|uniref:porin n=1 Tax=Actinobacillus porcinus TaxID=51048 RepID=UPI0023561233|nr:porin [Actinobacillus porcinus]
MKKTLVALLVAAAAASASATTVYNNEGTTVDVGGRLDVMIGKFNENERTDLRNNESRIEFKAQHDLGNGLKAIAFTRFRFNDKDGDRWDTQQSFNNIKTNKLWLGFEAKDIGRVTFGKQDTNGDAIQINDNAYIFGGNNNVLDGGDKVLSFRSADFQIAEGHKLGFGTDYVFGQSTKDNKNVQLEDELKYGYNAVAFYEGNFSGLKANLNAGYTVAKYDDATDSNVTGSQEKSWRVASKLGYGPAEFGVEYGETKFENGHTDAGKGKFLEVAAKYNYLENASVYTAWEHNVYKGDTDGLAFDVRDANFLRSVAGKLSVENGGKLTENVFILGTDYAFTPNVVTYAEYAYSHVKANSKAKIEGAGVTGYADGTAKAKDHRYGVGVRVYF